MSASTAAAITLIAACTPPMPPDVLAARAERTITCIDGTQQVTTPLIYFEAVSGVGQALNALCPEQSIEPTLEASAVVLLDHPPTGQELADFSLQCRGDVTSTPVFGSPIVLAYNIAGLDGLLLTPEAVAGILSGRITQWSDRLIAEQNEGFDIPDIPIELQRLSTPSGAVEAISEWLTKEAPESWTAGPVNTLTAGVGHATYADLIAAMTGDTSNEDIDDLFEDDFDFSLNGEESFDDSFNDLVGDDVEIDLEADLDFDALPGEGTVAVLPAFLANVNVIPIADFPVGRNVISITNVDLTKVGIAATEVSTDESGRLFASHAVGGLPAEGQFDQASAKVVFDADQDAVGWPVVSMASILACDETTTELPLSTAQFFVRLAGQGVFDSVGLVPLPEPIRIQAIPAVKITLDDLDDDSIELGDTGLDENVDGLNVDDLDDE